MGDMVIGDRTDVSIFASDANFRIWKPPDAIFASDRVSDAKIASENRMRKFASDAIHAKMEKTVIKKSYHYNVFFLKLNIYHLSVLAVWNRITDFISLKTYFYTTSKNLISYFYQFFLGSREPCFDGFRNCISQNSEMFFEFWRLSVTGTKT